MASEFTTKTEEDFEEVLVRAKSEHMLQDYEEDDSFNTEDNDACSLSGREMDSPPSHPGRISLPSFVQTHLSSELISEGCSDLTVSPSFPCEPLLIDEEHRVIQWLQDVLTEDPHGRIHVKDLSEMAAGQFGGRKRHLGTWLRKAFPSVYVRRSDRLRWYCGVSVKSEKSEMSQTELAIKEWKDKAVHWLRTALDINPSYKEKWSDIHRALNTYVGQSPSTEVAITAFKMAFPSIPRRVYDRTAFYVGIRFLDSALVHQVDELSQESQKGCSEKVLPSKIQAITYTPQFNFDKVIIAWLQKALISDKERYERLRSVMNLLKRKFFPELKKKHFLRILRKGFPAVEYYSRDREGLLLGVRIDDKFVENHFSSWKIISWLKENVLQPCINGSVRATQIYPILQEKLGVGTPFNAIRLVQVAFPEAQCRQWSEGAVAYGVELKEGYRDIRAPDFDAIDYFDDSDDESVVIGEKRTHTEEAVVTPRLASRHILTNPKTIFPVEPTCRPAKRTRVPSEEMEGHCCETVKDCSLTSEGIETLVTSPMETRLCRIDERISTLSDQIGDLQSQFKALREDLTKTIGQKDALISQLQQTLVMLCQQQLKNSQSSSAESVLGKS